MKAMYIHPTTQVVVYEAESLLQGVSGVGLKDGGQATSPLIVPKAPHKPF